MPTRVPDGMYAAMWRSVWRRTYGLTVVAVDSDGATTSTASRTITLGGVEPAPFAFFNWINPLVAMAYGFAGFTIERLPASEGEAVDRVA